jgi:gamma-glutamyltranspeptidase/glutathione hydrolase
MQTGRMLWLLIAMVVGPGGWRPAQAAWPAPLVVPARKGAVAADSPAASRAGAEMLAKGGNAVDAAVATALALGVVQPEGSGLGGGGFLVFFNAREGKARVLDFRETAPAAASRDMFLSDGKADPARSQLGGLAVAVPGEAAGLAELEAKYGKLGLREVTQPAIRLARNGFEVSAHLAEAVQTTLARKVMPDDEPLKAWMAPGGRPLKEHDVARRPDLARTLERFAKLGAAGFYEGPVASAIVSAAKRRGGILTEADLRAYRPVWREPLTGSFRGRVVYAAPPPAGGATAIEALQVLDARGPLTALGAGSSAADHLIAEALKHSFADRARSLGDPAFVEVPTRHLVDPAYAKELAARISTEKVQKPESYGDKALAGGIDQPHDHGTSHLDAVDGDGNVVALTTTINLLFGAKLIAGDTGVVLNNEMDDFSAQPGVPNYFGLIGAFANAIAPGKRPLSSMTPLVIVRDGKPELAVGGSGGPLIVSETLQSVVNVIDFGMNAEAAVSSPRIHAQWVPDVLVVEPEVPADVVEGLKRRGHKVVPPPVASGTAAQLIVIAPELLQAASDPRKGGAPAAP